MGTRNGAQGLLRESKLETHSEGRNEIVGADKISESREKMEYNHVTYLQATLIIWFEQGPYFKEKTMDQAYPARDGHMTQKKSAIGFLLKVLKKKMPFFL